MKAPLVYFAGKISKNCYRGWFVNDFMVLSFSYGKTYTVGGRPFVYGGPIALSCDHGCFHMQHGLSSCGEGCEGGIMNHIGSNKIENVDKVVSEETIFKQSLSMIKAADIFFFYLEEEQQFGTLIEIGSAVALRKPVLGVIEDKLWKSCGNERMDKNELWFVKQCGNVIISTTENLKEASNKLLGDYLAALEYLEISTPLKEPSYLATELVKPLIL